MEHICRYVGIYILLLLSLSALIETLVVVYPEHTYEDTFLFWKEPEEELGEAFCGRRQHLRRHRTMKRCATFSMKVKWLVKIAMPQ